MNWNLPGKDCSIYVEFKKDGEFVIPDPGSLKLTLRDDAGVVITGYDSLALANCLVSSLMITVLAALNTVGTGLPFETRYARIDYTASTEPLHVDVVYRVAPFLPMASEPAEVRALFGARDLELPDSDIDLYSAYFLLLQDYPDAMTGALSSAATSWSANRAIVLTAGLQVIASMPGRLLKEDALNTAKQIRGNIDWEALEARLGAELGVVLAKLQAAASVAGGTFPTLIFMRAAPALDVITNA
jgi:hypothetical protein